MTCCFSLLFHYLIVPSEPEHVVVLTIEGSPTELQVIWDPPADPNGLVIAYTVYCTASGMEHKLVLSGNTSQVVVTNLLPYTFYDCYVTANTSAGEGNSSIVQSVRTPESGKLLIINFCQAL